MEDKSKDERPSKNSFFIAENELDEDEELEPDEDDLIDERIGLALESRARIGAPPMSSLYHRINVTKSSPVGRVMLQGIEAEDPILVVTDSYETVVGVSELGEEEDNDIDSFVNTKIETTF